MSKTLSEKFAEARSSSIEEDGVMVYSMHEFRPSTRALQFDLCPGEVSFEQGIVVKSLDGEISINGISARSFELWTNSAPPHVRVDLEPSRGASQRIRVWNIWRNDAFGTQAWIGNSGILVQDSETGFVLECSNGEGAANFGDLVVTISTVPGS